MTSNRIVITPGETDLINTFKELDIPHDLENLLVGDAQLRNSETNETLYIFERKSKTDLDASIKDGRYKEQKARLIDTGVPLKNIVYVIENLKYGKHDVSQQKRLWSAMCNTQHRDGFSVFQTKNLTETAKYIQGISKSVEEFEQNQKSTDENKEVNVNIKKSAVTPETWLQYSLALIPRCSPQIANSILQKYGTLSSLLIAFEKYGVYCLSDIRHSSSQRRIGKNLSRDIYYFIVSKHFSHFAHFSHL